MSALRRLSELPADLPLALGVRRLRAEELKATMAAAAALLEKVLRFDEDSGAMLVQMEDGKLFYDPGALPKAEDAPQLANDCQMRARDLRRVWGGVTPTKVTSKVATYKYSDTGVLVGYRRADGLEVRVNEPLPAGWPPICEDQEAGVRIYAYDGGKVYSLYHRSKLGQGSPEWGFYPPAPATKLTHALAEVERQAQLGLRQAMSGWVPKVGEVAKTPDGGMFKNGVHDLMLTGVRVSVFDGKFAALLTGAECTNIPLGTKGVSDHHYIHSNL